MAESLTLAAAPVLTRPRGRSGGSGRSGGGVGIEIRTPAMALLAARKGRLESLREAARGRWGVELPAAPVFVDAMIGRVSWAGPAQWLVMTDTANDRLDADIAGAFPRDVSVTAQGDGRFVVRISGPRAREALMKGVPVDLHDRAFPPGSTALTAVAHINMQLWRLGADVFEAAVFRGYADSFADWLFESAAEFGIDVT
jgi:sarcosine oxidase subunit gamma